MHVVIFSKIYKEEEKDKVQLLFDQLAKHKIRTSVHRSFYHQIKEAIYLEGDVDIFNGYEDLRTKKIDFMLTLGGDGTMLSAITEIRDREIPILGLNLGRLGFLASVEFNQLSESIEALLLGKFTIEERTMLELESNYPLFDGVNFALNDCTILKRDTSSMVRINTYINGDFLNSYWADGLIISTPTGSTGYSLSCGGPIVFPDSGCFIITPVAPHNLSVRPIVISDNSVLSFDVEGRAENFLCTLDSRFSTITASHEIAIKKCSFKAKIVQINETGFMQTIRKKLDWGKDIRN